MDTPPKCPACSFLLEKKCRFCSDCGQKLDPALWEVQNTTYKCICGEECAIEKRFCSDCGEKNPSITTHTQSIGKDESLIVEKNVQCTETKGGEELKPVLQSAQADSNQNIVDVKNREVHSQKSNTYSNNSNSDGESCQKLDQQTVDYSGKTSCQELEAKSEVNDEVGKEQISNPAEGITKCSVLMKEKVTSKGEETNKGPSDNSAEDVPLENTDCTVPPSQNGVRGIESGALTCTPDKPKPDCSNGSMGENLHHKKTSKSKSSKKLRTDGNDVATSDNVTNEQKLIAGKDAICVSTDTSVTHDDDYELLSNTQSGQGNDNAGNIHDTSQGNNGERNLQEETGHDFAVVSVKGTGEPQIQEKNEGASAHQIQEKNEGASAKSSTINPEEVNSSHKENQIPGFMVKSVEGKKLLESRSKSNFGKLKSELHTVISSNTCLQPVTTTSDEPFKSVFGSDAAKVETTYTCDEKVFGNSDQYEKKSNQLDKQTQKTGEPEIKPAKANKNKQMKDSTEMHPLLPDFKSGHEEIKLVCNVRNMIDMSASVKIVLPASSSCQDLITEVSNIFDYQQGSFQCIYALPKSGKSYKRVDILSCLDQPLCSICVNRGDRGNAFMVESKNGEPKGKVKNKGIEHDAVKCIVRNIVEKISTEIVLEVQASFTCAELLKLVAEAMGFKEGSFSFCHVKQIGNKIIMVDLESCLEKPLYNICANIGKNNGNLFTVNSKLGMTPERVKNKSEEEEMELNVHDMTCKDTTVMTIKVPFTWSCLQLVEHVAHLRSYDPDSFILSYLTLVNNKEIKIQMPRYSEEWLSKFCAREASKAKKVFTITEIDGIAPKKVITRESNNETEGKNAKEDFNKKMLQSSSDIKTSKHTSGEVIAYNKRETEPESFYEGKGTKEKRGMANKKEFAEKFAEGHFYVVVSPEFKFNRQKENVKVKFFHPKLHQAGYELNEDKERSTEKYHVMHGWVKIPKDLLKLGLFYYYVVERINSVEKEFLYHKDSSGSVNDSRMLFVPHNIFKDSDTWNQYDGIMYPKPENKNVISQLRSFFNRDDLKKIMKQNKKAALLLMPRWAGLTPHLKPTCYTAEETIKEISRLYNCMKEFFFDNGGSRQDPSQFQEVLFDYLDIRLKHLMGIKGKNRKPETPMEAAHRLSSALAIIYLSITYELTIQKHDINQAIFHALLMNIDENKSCFEYESLLQKEFPTMKEELLPKVVKYVRYMATDYYIEDTWLFAIPIIHFLEGTCDPYVPLTPSTNHTSIGWWGEKNLEGVKYEYMKKKSLNKDVPVKMYLQNLSKYFDVDSMLPRTLIALMPNESDIIKLFQTGLFAPEICMANLYYGFATGKRFCKNLEDVNTVTSQICASLQEESKTGAERKETWFPTVEVRCCIALDLLQTAIVAFVSSSKHEYIQHVLRVVVSNINCLLIGLEQAQKARQIEDQMLKYGNQIVAKHIEIATECITKWCALVLPDPNYVIETYPSIQMRNEFELQIFSWLVVVEFEDDKCRKMWNDKFLSLFKSRLNWLSAQQKLELACSVGQGVHHQLIEDELMSMAFDTLKSPGKKGEYQVLFNMARTRSEASRLGTLLSHLFQNNWPKEQGHLSTDPLVILQHTLTWHIFPKFIALFFGKEGNSDLLDGDIQEVMALSISVHQETERNFISGKIILRELELVLDNITQFADISHIIWSVDESTTDDQLSVEKRKEITYKVMHWRKKEFRQFIHIGEMVQTLIALSYEFPVDYHHLKNQLQMKFGDLFLNQICDPKLYSKATSTTMDYRPKITFYPIPEGLLSILGDIKILSGSLLFIKEWKYYLRLAYKTKKDLQGDNAVLTLEELQTEAWEPTNRAIQDMVYDLHQITMNLTTVNILFKSYKDDYKRLHADLLILCRKHLNPEWLAERVERIKQFHKINIYRVGAQKMKNVVNSLGLQGNYKVLDTLLSTSEGSNENMTLSDISASVISVGEGLMDVTEDKASCIGVLSDCHQLVDWLRDLKQGTKEIKVLVDLAMMSAQGQSDMEVEKVQCLSDAAMGYAPLIYELDPKADFQEFLKQCHQVWKSFEKDDNLPSKLQELSRNLEWLENIKKSHGSTELNALAQAQSINTRGIFKVGFIQDLAANDYDKTLDTVIQLMVQPAQDKQSKKHLAADNRQVQQPKLMKYGLQQLNDLQSRLMLVAGRAAKGKEDVDRFVEILDGITRLGKVYIKLCSAGSIIFKRWTVIFHCDANKKVHTEVDFGLSKKIMKGSTDMKLNVTAQIVQLCEFLENCLVKWTKEIDEKRQDYYYLNCYTTEQLVILRKEIAKLCNGEAVDKVIYPMLDSVKAGCTPMDLSIAIKDAFKSQIEKNEESDDSNNEEQHNTENDQTSEEQAKNEQELLKSKRQMVANFIDELVSSGYSERLAVEALKNVDGPDCVEDAIIWCLENEDMELEDINPEILALSETEPVGGSSMVGEGSQVDYPHHTMMDYSSLVHSVTLDHMTSLLLDSIIEPEQSLKRQLENLWQTYVEKSGTTSVSDFLNVEHLGMILQKLAEQVSKETTIERPFPKTFNLGKPNLLLCPKAEVLQTVLSVYMCDNGQEIPVPSSTEVLLCTPQTRAEEVILLLRRCFDERENHGEVYCLVNADRLDYEVSTKVEATFDKLSRQVSTEYRLVIICSRENADKSSIATNFDKFTVKNFWMFDLDEIQGYLQKHFTVKATADANIAPAATLDPQRLSVRVVQSKRAGVGKTLKAKRLAKQMKQVYKDDGRDIYINISLHRRHVDSSAVLKDFLWYTEPPGRSIPKLFHLDISHEVLYGVDDLLFNLLVLGSLTDQQGHVWLRSDYDLYVIETLPLIEDEVRIKSLQHPGKSSKHGPQFLHPIFHLLPKLTCWSPKDSFDILGKIEGTEGEIKLTSYPDFKRHDQLMDQEEFASESWQRVYQYLKRFHQGQNLDTANPANVEGTHIDCLQVLLKYCGIKDPSWAELRHFVWFLNIQLKDSEQSSFTSVHVAEDLPGFKLFVVKSMIQMSRDFATRSLNISEETPGIMDYIDNDEMQVDEGDDDDPGIERFQMKRRWETSPHPYIFFNSDHHSMTFLGFNIERRTGNMIDLQTGQILEHGVMQRQLQEGLQRNGVPLKEDFDSLPRDLKIMKLCNVMGNTEPHDPDETYVLTTDNVKKIMAIFMRFRCGIPVIIMGETGCGKTRLVKFMCDLQKPRGLDIDNMILMKVHGGTTERDIKNKLREATKLSQAIKLAAASKYEESLKIANSITLKAAEKLLAEIHWFIENNKAHPDVNDSEHMKFPNVNVVLFFDEANTTEEIGLIKQVMCDHIAQMETSVEEHGLKIVAACNPYRKHSDDMIKRLEHAGLGYHIKADQTTDKLGRIPMRRLVYRVQALPQSMLPLVWDFGQLSTDTEQKYIQQMVRKFVKDEKLPSIPNLEESLSKILAESQEFMRRQEDECSFVSLRDVERTLNVMAWFHEHKKQLFTLINNQAVTDMAETQRIDPEEVHYQPPNDITRCMILALGVCYHACLQKRKEYRKHVARHFTQPLQLQDGPHTLFEEINRCQDVFLDQIDLDVNIAKNQALKENVFMMIVCIELRIPLFLVGKPGSSKSLAKTIVADAMQGDTAKSEFFKTLKFVHMVSFQCSPLATPDGIVGTFKQCATLQQTKKELNKYVSVVVLDEVGLAEDSPRMPLKTLHPLLEDGCEGDEEPEPYKKVAFIGISNWALDPAKMNRGILVQRGVPDEKELVLSARGICETDQRVQNNINVFMEPIAKAYLEIYKVALEKEDREYFGLRDFYSIIKMIYGFAKRSEEKPTWFELKHSIMRNFGGLESVDPMEVFEKHITINVDKQAPVKETDPDCTPAGLIQACLFGKGLQEIDIQSRYLLILTENYASLKILQQHLLHVENAITIFGSSFPKDQEYTQVCRNINRIKICMETGQTVVLLNLENLYESLYDALNQYYVYFGGQQFVDLGLGTHRVKCRVHKDFRLIVVAEKQVVYKTFPIPLINRLEKHTLTMETMLSPEQLELTQKLQNWAKAFAEVEFTSSMDYTGKRQKCSVGDVFIGYDKDTPASIVLQVSEEVKREHLQGAEECSEDDDDEGIHLQMEIQMIQKCKEMLLQCATPESIIRLCHSYLRVEEEKLARIYDSVQKHDSLVQFLQHYLQTYHNQDLFAQITTHSKLLSVTDVLQISRLTGFPFKNIWLKSLQAFDTEQQFCKLLRDFFKNPVANDHLLILQCDSGNENAAMIASARYNILEEHKSLQVRRHVVFAIQLPRVAGGCFVGFQGGKWLCYHIDDLHPEEGSLPGLSVLKDQSISALFSSAINSDTAENEALETKFRSLSLRSGQTIRQKHCSGDHSYRTLLEDSGIPNETDEREEENSEERQYNITEEQREDEIDITDVHVDVNNPDNKFKSTPMTESAKSRTLKNVRGSLEQSLFPMSPVPGVGGDPGVPLITDDKSLDVDVILKNCVHSAAAMLEDDQKYSQRKTERVTMVMKLMEKKIDGHNVTFLDVIKKRVALLLRNKEEKQTTRHIATNWLTNDAASREAVAKAGTLRRSIWHHVESKVTPMLAGVLGYADADANLDHLFETEVMWKHQLWLEMLNSNNVTRLTYKDLQSATQHRELDRIQVAKHGCQGMNFKTALPFSWTIKETMDSLLYQSKQKGTVHEDEPIEAELEKYLHQSPLGVVLSKVLTVPEHMQDFTRLYLSDFIKMSYKPITQQEETIAMEYELMEAAILSAATQSALRAQTEEVESNKGEETQQEPLKLTLSLIHMTFMNLQSRLQLITQAFNLWPEAASQVGKFMKTSNHSLTAPTEFTLDVVLLTLILEHLQPALDDKQKIDELDGSPQLRQGWIRRVERFQLLIERMLGFMEKDYGSVWTVPLGEKCLKQLDVCRCIYSRVCAVQLLIEHACLANDTDMNLGFKKCKPLWKLLGEHVNFKSLKSIENVEKFLKASNISAYKHFFKSVHKCPHCKELMEDPIHLPCKHVVCNSCVQLGLQMDQHYCPECKEPYSKKFKPTPGKDQKREALEGYRDYKKKCNLFFMSLVSRLCFQGDKLPDEELIHKLLGYITKKSEFDDGEVILSQQIAPLKDRDAIDPTPVVRSFLLQLLLRSYMNKVHTHIDDYFNMARKVLGEKDLKHTTELALLIAHCFEDAHHHKYQKQSSVRESLSFVRSLLRDADEYLTEDGLNVVKLRAIAGTRFSLQVVADWLYKVYVEGDNLAEVACKELFDSASAMCTREDTRWPRLFLIRQFNQKYGIDSLQQLAERIVWLVPQDTNNQQEQEHPDRFVVCGEKYQAIREAIAQFLVTKDVKALESTLKGVKENGILKHRDILLALYTEVTSCNRYEVDEKKIHPEVLTALEQFITTTKAVRENDLALSLIQNKLSGSCERLIVKPNQGWQLTMLTEMVVHFIIKINTMDMSILMQPFRILATKPDRMADVFLPTMPQEDLQYVNEAMQKYLKQSHSHEKVEVYKCPNGHPYVIGDCGKPYYKANCNECGKPIGGAGHQLERDNIKLETVEENSLTGHILGMPENRKKVPSPERQMTPASTAILRLLTHMSMYAGSNSNPEAIAAMIVPGIPVDAVPDFLWGHIVCDLEVLANALSKSPDDCVLLMHMVMNGIIRNSSTNKRIDPTLKTKESREKWEAKFVDEYVKPVLHDINNRLQNANNDLVSDKRLGNNPLLQMIYEAHDDTEVDVQHIDMMFPMWRLRSQVNLEHLTQQVNECSLRTAEADTTSIKVLQLFLKHEHQLRALQYLPRIIQLQRLLVQRYNGAIDKSEATTMTVRRFLMNLQQGIEDEEFKHLIKDFAEVWDLIKQQLPPFGFVGHSVPMEYCDTKVDMKDMSTNMAMFLPSWKGQGLCSVAVVYYLCTVQNNFLEEYSKLIVQSQPQEIHSQNVTVADLVAYDPDRDLLPLVVANCNYSVSVKEGISQKYDLEGLARQVQERFLRSRCIVIPQVEQVIFREDFTNAVVFTALNEKIEQEPMSFTLQQQIITECRHVKEITESLARLDITISFLVSLGQDKEALLGEYMNKTLNMKKALHSEKAMQQCCMKHVRSLWLLLSHERAKMLAKYAQDPFDNVSEKYRHSLTQEQIGSLHATLYHTNVDVFLRQLYECILLQITVLPNAGDEEVVDNTENHLGFTLDAYIQSVDGPDIPVLTDDTKFPADIQVKHSVSTWQHAYTYARNTKD